MDEGIFRKIVSEEVRKILSESLPEVMTLEQACDYLQVSDTWLKSNLEKEQIPYFKTGRHYKFNLSELREWTRHRNENKVTKPIINQIKRKTSGIMSVSL